MHISRTGRGIAAATTGAAALVAAALATAAPASVATATPAAVPHTFAAPAVAGAGAT